MSIKPVVGGVYRGHASGTLYRVTKIEGDRLHWSCEDGDTGETSVRGFPRIVDKVISEPVTVKPGQVWHRGDHIRTVNKVENGRVYWTTRGDYFGDYDDTIARFLYQSTLQPEQPAVGSLWKSYNGSCSHFNFRKVTEIKGDRVHYQAYNQDGSKIGNGFNCPLDYWYSTGEPSDTELPVITVVRPGQVWKCCGFIRTVTKVEGDRVYWKTEGYGDCDNSVAGFTRQSTLISPIAIGSVWSVPDGSCFRKVTRVDGDQVYYTSHQPSGYSTGEISDSLANWHEENTYLGNELPKPPVEVGQVYSNPLYRFLITEVTGDRVTYDYYLRDGTREHQGTAAVAAPGTFLDRVTGFQVGYRQHGNKIIKVLCDKSSYPTREAAALSLIKVGEVYRHNEHTIRKVVKINDDKVHYDVYDNKGVKLNSTDRYCAFVHFRRNEPTVLPRTPQPGDWYKAGVYMLLVDRVDGDRVYFKYHLNDKLCGYPESNYSLSTFLAECTHCPDYKLPATVKPGDWYSYCAAMYQVTKVENGRVYYDRYTKDGRQSITPTGDWEIGEFLTCCTHCPDYKLPVVPDPFAGTPCYYVNPSTLEVRQGVFVKNDEGKYSFKCKLGYWTYVSPSDIYQYKLGVRGRLLLENDKKVQQINKEWQ
jgi:hypothetical protein